MSSSGYPRIQFGYDDATDNEEDSGEDEDEVSTNPDEPGPNGGGNQRHNLVSRSTDSSPLLLIGSQRHARPIT
jgi:translation initiation factor 2-alpha kinase 4